MTMKHFVIVAALCTMALSAQSYRGTFTLPVETQWGAAHLQPGDYTMSTDTVGSMPVIYVWGNGINVSILPGPTMNVDPSLKGGHLELTEVNGTYAVTKLVAGTVGKEYTFAVPKALSKQGTGVVALKKAVLPVH